MSRNDGPASSAMMRSCSERVASARSTAHHCAELARARTKASRLASRAMRVDRNWTPPATTRRKGPTAMVSTSSVGTGLSAAIAQISTAAATAADARAPISSNARRTQRPHGLRCGEKYRGTKSCSSLEPGRVECNVVPSGSCTMPGTSRGNEAIRFLAGPRGSRRPMTLVPFNDPIVPNTCFFSTLRSGERALECMTIGRRGTFRAWVTPCNRVPPVGPPPYCGAAAGTTRYRRKGRGGNAPTAPLSNPAHAVYTSGQQTPDSPIATS